MNTQTPAQDVSEALRQAAIVLELWEGEPDETGYMGDFNDAAQILLILADHAARGLQQAQVVESSAKEEEEESYPTCRYCNRENVSCDGTARYDKQANEWRLSGTFDGGYCDDCEEDQKFFNWVNTLR